MHYSFRLTGEAEQDLHDIARYIAQGHPEAVERFLANFEAVCDELCVFPGLGAASPFHHHPTLRDLRRCLVTGFEKYSVFYHAAQPEKMIEVVRILLGARDLPAVFGEAA